MKLHLYFLWASLLFVAFTTNAQITITQSDMPFVGKVFISANDNVLNGISVGSSGTNKFWNLSNLQNNSLDTAAFISPSGLAGAGYFPTANLAISFGGGSVFYNVNSSTMSVLGDYIDFGPPQGYTAVKFNPALKIITYPSTYMTSFNGTSSFLYKFASASPGIDSVKQDITDNYTSTIDGWGTITTPAFSNVPCLRQVKRTYSSSTNYNHMIGGGWVQQGPTTLDTSYYYSWWSNTKKFPIADIQTKAYGTIEYASYLLIQSSVGIEEEAFNNTINVFPNPASDFITIAGLSEISSLNIFDITGKLIESRLLKNSDTPINISTYENGIYFYEVSDKDKNTIGKGKFVVAN